MIPVPQEVLEALAAVFGTSAASLYPMGKPNAGADGITYSYPQDGQARVLKVLAPSAADPYSLQRLNDRLAFMHYLGEHGARIVPPIPLPSGALYHTLPHGDTVFAAYRMPLAAGHHPQSGEWSPPLLRAWGAMVGMMHRITQSYPIWNPVESGAVKLFGWEGELEDFYNMCRDQQVKAFWLTMRDRLRALPIERSSYGFIHNDPHMMNILFNPPARGEVALKHLTLLDFDVANCHWFITDISVALQSVLFQVSGGMEAPLRSPQAARDFLAHFMEGYQAENTLDPFWLSQLDLFILYRRALLFTVMQDWIDTKPELHARWKRMILSEAPVFGEQPLAS